MSRESLIARGRVAAEAGMVDRCQIRRVTGSTVDDNTGEEGPTYAELYGFDYPTDPLDGRCKFQQASLGGAARSSTPGEDFQLLLQLELHLPIAAPELAVDDEVTVTAAAVDPELVGLVFIVRDLHAKTFATARRVGITRRTS